MVGRREKVAQRTAEPRQETDTIKLWPSEQCAQPLLESMIYIARRPRIAALVSSTILRRVVLLRVCFVAAPLILCKVFYAFTMEFWPLSWSHLEIQAHLQTWNVIRNEGEVLLLYIQSHIRDRTWNPIYLSRYRLLTGKTRWDLASVWFSWG